MPHSGYHCTLYVHSRLNAYHASKVCSGLCGLAACGAIALATRWDRSGDADPLVLRLKVKDGSVMRRLAIDLYDRSDTYSLPALEWADVYLKRSYYDPDLNGLEGPDRHKVAPFGLNFACRGFGATAKLFRALIVARIAECVAGKDSRPAGLMGLIKGLRLLSAVPRAVEFEIQVPPEPTVVFQTRVWEPGDTGPDDAQSINEERVAIVRELRRALGRQFVGGLVPTDYARKYFTDAVTDQDTHRSKYAALARRSLVGVYTRGLHQSTAFKLPEYLAAGRAVVAGGLRNALPVALEPNRHYRCFATPDQCAQYCVELLQNPGLAAAMGAANRAYYLATVEPMAHMRQCLQRAMKSTATPCVVNA